MALTDQDYDNIEARFMKAIGYAATSTGVLPCNRHDARVTRLEQMAWKLLGAMALAGFLGAGLGGAMFARAANRALASVSTGIGATP